MLKAISYCRYDGYNPPDYLRTLHTLVEGIERVIPDDRFKNHTLMYYYCAIAFKRLGDPEDPTAR